MEVDDPWGRYLWQTGQRQTSGPRAAARAVNLLPFVIFALILRKGKNLVKIFSFYFLTFKLCMQFKISIKNYLDHEFWCILKWRILWVIYVYVIIQSDWSLFISLHLGSIWFGYLYIRVSFDLILNKSS